MAGCDIAQSVEGVAHILLSCRLRDIFWRCAMNRYQHHVSGFFDHRDEAPGTSARLVASGLPRDRQRLLDANLRPSVPASGSDANEVLTNVLVACAIGAAVGTGIGALVQVMIVAGSVSLFNASPLMAPLVMLGWCAGLGGLFGAAGGTHAGNKHKDGRRADTVSDAIASVPRNLPAHGSAAVGGRYLRGIARVCWGRHD